MLIRTARFAVYAVAYYIVDPYPSLYYSVSIKKKGYTQNVWSGSQIWVRLSDKVERPDYM